MRRAVLVVVVAALVAAALFLTLFLMPPGRQSRPVVEKCVLVVEAEPELGDAIVLNGTRVPERLKLNLTCGSTLVLKARPARYWRLAYWLVNGTRAGSERVLRLVVRRDTTVVAVFERLMCRLRVEANATGARARVGGKEVELPYEAVLPCGSRVTIEPVAPEGFRALNRSATLALESNVTLRLLYAKLGPAKLCSLKHGVYVAANVPKALVTASGKRTELPACLAPPVELEGEWYVPLNETHGYWLAWYWVELSNGTRYWWSPTLNGSKLKVDQPANVTLHYVLGLKELPYVRRVIEWPWYKWDTYCTWRVEDRQLELECTRLNPHLGYYSGTLLIELPEEVGIISIAATGRVYGNVEIDTIIRGGCVAPGHVYTPGGRCGGRFKALWVLNYSRLRELVRLYGNEGYFEEEVVLRAEYEGCSAYRGKQEYGVLYEPPDFTKPVPLPPGGPFACLYVSGSEEFKVEVRVVGVAP